MSSSIQAPSSSTQPIFDKALAEYKKKTGKDLTTHPLAVEIKNCRTPEAILTVLEKKANELAQCRSSDEGLIKWLNPTVNILNALSATLGEGVGSVFPPTKIIFSGLGILLVAAKSTVTNRNVLVELFYRIESFFGRLKTYTEVPPTQVVTDVLVKILAEVLSILAIATKGVKERRTKIFLKKLAGMNDSEDALQRLRQLEQGELLVVIAQLSRDEQETNRIVKEILIKMDARSWEEVPQKLKGWLSPPDPSTNYNVGLRDLHEETATWFLDGRIFQEWYLTSPLLWIHGKPGSGKSILCSAIIQRMVSLSDSGRASVAYFYFDFRDDNKKHRHDLLLSLLVQFAAHSTRCCDIISRVYSSHGKGTQRPNDEVLIDCLMNMLSTTTQHPMYIIVDALDECPNTFGVRSPRERVLSLIKDLVDPRLPNLHVCVTSRPEIDICIRLEPLTSLRVSLHDQIRHKEDIAKYIRSEVNYIAINKRWREAEKELVIETLSEKADGMFRWVFCQLEVLRLCLRSNVRHFLNELPDSLDETYEHVLKEIHKTNRVHVQRLLQCLAVAIRPLRVDELARIIAFNLNAVEGDIPKFDADLRSEDQEQDLLSACPSLITITSSHGSRIVQFSHFSVKEFLTSDRLAASSEDISRYYILPEDAHTTLARTSLGVLLGLDDRVERCRAIPLVEYASHYWVSHAQVGSVSSRVIGMMETLFDSEKPHFSAWVRLHDIDRPPLLKWRLEKTSRNPLYYSALCGFSDLVVHLVKKHPEHINATGGEHDYPLAAALYGGHIQIAELLFQHGANVNIHGSEEQTPLHTVIEWPMNLVASAVPFLLNHGADVNARRKDLSTPLHLATTLGNFDQVVDVNSRKVSSEAPLRLVQKSTSTRSGGNRANLVQLLLEHGANVDSRDEKDATTLHYASLMRDLNVAQMLLDHGANVNAEDNWGRTPLHRVLEGNHDSENDRFSVAQLLVEHGADINAGHKVDAETPLHLASYLLEVKLVRMFLDHGANVNVKDNWGRTPLHRVLEARDYCDDDRFGVAQLLIERGADVNAHDDVPKTPLHLASYFPDLSLVRMLLDRGAIIDAKDGWGRTPLHRVLEAQDYSVADRFVVARLLMERGADVNAQDEDHETPLHLASCFLEAKLVRMLLDHGAKVNAEDKQGRTPLHRVPGPRSHSDEDCFIVARQLVDRGADVNAGHKDHETPLHLASRFLQVKLVQMFLDHGANINVKDSQGRTALHRVLEDSHNSDEDRFGVARLLVERGADVNMTDNYHETPSHLASRLPSLEVAWLLLKHGADQKAENQKGKVPVQRRVMREASGKK
ncbi:Ankyrin repeat-containing domain protein [Lactarius tabidus]